MQKVLTDLGLSPSAAQLYLELLQSGPSSVEQLSTATGIKRTSVYPYIAELKTHSLITWNERETGKAIQATNLDSLMALAEQKQREANQSKLLLEQALPSFTAMQQLSDDTYSVQKYVGVDQCRQAIEQVYQEPVLYGYCGEFEYTDLGEDWYKQHLKHMYKELKIPDQVIFPAGAIAQVAYAKLKKTNWYDEAVAQYRIHPTLDLPAGLDVYILHDRVLTLISDPQPTCLIIKSEKFRNYEKSLFDALYAAAVPIQDWK